MGRRLSSIDNLFLQLERQTTPMHVGGVLLFSGDEEGVDSRYQRLVETAVRAEPFNLRLLPAKLPGQRPSWEPVHTIDVASHVKRHVVPAGDDPAALMTFISDLHTPHLDRGRPMWECHVLDGIGEGRFGLYYKVHHALIDGVGGAKRMQDGLSDQPAGATAPLWAYEPPPRKPREPRLPLSIPARLARSMRSLRGNAGLAMEVASALRETMRGAGDTGRAAAPYRAPRTGLNNMLCGQRQVAWQRLPMGGVRAIGKAAGATLNEVALAICSTVVRNALLRAGDLPDQPLVVMVPVSLHAPGGGASEGNLVTGMNCNLPTQLSDPQDRLRAVMASSQDAKRLIRQMTPEAAMTYAIVAGFPAIVAMLLGQYDRFKLPFNLVVSNVPGPRTPLYDSGARLDAVYPASLLWERQALNFTLVSYLDHLDVGLVACGEAVPDLPHVARDLHSAYEELHRAVLG